jgi:hypothetical protein
MSKKSPAIHPVRAAIDALPDPITMEVMNKFKVNVRNRLGGSITALIKASYGKPMSVVLNSILSEVNDYDAYSRPDFEKYLIDNNNPSINCNIISVANSAPMLEDEILYMFSELGVKKTMMLYMLVIYHMAD